MNFADMSASPVSFDEASKVYEEIDAEFHGASTPDARLAALRRWDELRAHIETWRSLVHVHFNQDTRDEARKQARDEYDEAAPKLTELATNFIRKLVEGPHRDELRESLGEQSIALWDAAITTYDPSIEQETVQESKLTAEYTELMASAAIDFQGETHNLSTMRKFAEDPDRDVRRRADELTWGWFDEKGEQLDRIFDELVKLRTAMASKLGFDNYLALAYRKMSRTDYGPSDVARYRDAIREHVVPLGQKLRERQREKLGVKSLMAWDLNMHDPAGNPRPQGDHDWMVERAHEMFQDMGSGLGGFFAMMDGCGLLDLKSRPGKAAGGFCTSLTSYKVPFIYANFNGTKGDVEVFTHEMGHAFQSYSSREQFPMEYLWPTAEACEIHSMGLEYLTWPLMEKFFGDDAQRFRRVHLTSSLLFLPYGATIDHFQHEVYENPDATPAERHAMWNRLSAMYLPWVDYGGMKRPEEGAVWQRQLHVYLYPLYYIDYTLAEICALQYRAWAERDRVEAMDSYVALCKRGGEAPFQTLAREAGLTSPFDAGCLERVVGETREVLGV